MTRSTHQGQPRVLMFVSSSDLTDLQAKGVDGMLLDRDESGYFEKVISVHPWARATRTVRLTPTHVLEEMGRDRLPIGSRHRLVRRFAAPYLVLDSVFRMRAIIRREQVTMVRASDPFWTASATWLACVGTGARFVISVHADWRKRCQLDRRAVPRVLGSFRLAQGLAAFNVRRSDAVAVVRESLVQLVSEWGANDSAIFYLPHVVEDSLFDQSDLGGGDKLHPRPYAFFAGRVTKENYIFDLIAAFERLPEGAELDLVIAGDGDQIPWLTKYLRSRPALRSRVVLLGFIPRSEVASWRRGAAVNVCLMGGYSLIEACASGRPVISYDVEWHSELVVTGATGFLVEDGNVDSITEALRAAVREPTLSDEMGRRARERAALRHAKANAMPIRWRAYDQMFSRGDVDESSFG